MTERHPSEGGHTPGISTADALDRILAAVAARTGTAKETLDPNARFSELGMDSLGLTALGSEVGRTLGVQLPPTAGWDHPTPEALARHLADAGRRRPPAEAPADGSAADGDREPIAVVGMACRFPGAPDLESYWQLLLNGGDAVTDVPADRWDADALYAPDPAAVGRAATRWGGFLDGVDRFDPAFFGISPREARLMDPQQRIMLELAWTALEDWGRAPGGLRDRRIGVFTAALWNDYARLAGRDLDAIGQHTATGEDLSIIPARISYALGLRGPSIGVTTACSGSLVAVHLACQSLRDGESEVALAGGVNLLLAPESTVAMTKFGAMSPRGRSRAFAADADGYVRAEGAGLLVLKPLSRALADGDRVYCVIRGSAVNNDGYSNGLTAPNPQAQEDMLRRACDRAGVDPRHIQYVEAHGTGTPLGDPIEAGALGRVLGRGRPQDQPLLVGSAKTNLGHLEAAAGAAGLIKTALALHHRAVPPSLHFEQPNPHIDFRADGLEVVTEARHWPEPRRDADGRLLAGVSSFGFGGTNCHVVLEAAATPAALLTLSASDDDALAATAAELRHVVDRSAPGTPLHELLARRHGPAAPGARRAAAVVTDRAGALGALTDVESTARASAHPGRGDRPTPRTVFVYSGQGSQWPGMGRDLLRQDRVFRTAVEDCDRAFAELAGWSLVDALRTADPARLARTDVLQPLVFAVQVGLTALWDFWGVRPDTVLGHSLGEAAAAWAAGRLGLRDAVRVVHHRSRLMARIDGKGAVGVVRLDPLRAAEAAARHGRGRVVTVAENGPLTTVLAGDPEALQDCLAALGRQGVDCHLVDMRVASHTDHCDPLLAELGDALATLRPLPARIPMVSTVTAGPADGPPDAEYWQRNLRRPVRFSGAVRHVLDDGPAVFMEIGPHPVLGRPLAETAEALGHDPVGTPVLPTLRRHRDARTCLLETAARLYEAGLNPVPPLPGDERRERLMMLSAHSEDAVRQQAKDVAHLLDTAPATDLEALTEATAELRTDGRHRIAAVVRDRTEAAGLLRTAAAGQEHPQLRTGTVARAHAGTAFVFSGQGTLWAGAGLALMRREPAFRHAMEHHEEILRELAGWSLREELGASPSRLGETAYAQPVLCALQLALVHLWQDWGVTPDAVAGHSVGEIAAASAAGVLTTEEALRLAVERGRVMEGSAGRGLMVSLALPEAEAKALIAGRTDRIGIAAVNSPYDTVVAGDTVAVEELLAAPGTRGLRVRRLPVDYAFHSPLTGTFEAELHDRLLWLTPGAGRVPLVSTVTGRILEGTRAGAAHWARSVREPVRFADAVTALAGLGCSAYVEIGAHPVLGASVAASLGTSPAGPDADDRQLLIVPTLRRGDDTSAPLVSRAALWSAGRAAPASTAGRTPAHGVRLPAYPWQRERHWIEEAPVGHGATAAPAAAGRPAVDGDGLRALFATVVERHPLSADEQALLPRLMELLEEARSAGAATGSAAGASPQTYTWTWRELPPAAPRTPAGHWLLVGTGPLTDALARRLDAAGAWSVTTAPAEPAELADVLAALGTEADAPLQAVHLHCAQDSDGDTSDAFDDVLQSALTLVHWMARRPGTAPARLSFVTRDVRPDAGGTVAPWKRLSTPRRNAAALWGFGATVAREHPDLWGALVDTDGTGPEHTADLLARELTDDGSGEDRIALRGGARHGARLIPSDSPRTAREWPALDPEAVYLITGGLGGVGLHLAGRLVDRGARTLVLAGRSEPSQRARGELDGFTERGVRVVVVQADLALRSDVEHLARRLGEEGGRLAGIVHAAGVLDDGILIHQTADRLRRVMAPKADGVGHLLDLAEPHRLDFFVLCSSYSGSLGAGGQAGYTAANAVLDVTALHLRAHGVPATSLGWGPWQGVGMTSGDDAERWRRHGLEPLTPIACLDVFDRALSGGTNGYEMVLAADWEAYAALLGDKGPRPFLHLVREPTTGEGRPRTGAPAQPGLALILDGAPAEEHHGLIADHVARRVAEALGISDARRLERDAGLFDLGLDSMGAMTLAQRLAKDLGERSALAPTAVFDHPSVSALAAHLATGAGAGAGPAAEPEDAAQAALEALLSEIEDLSDSEAALRLQALTEHAPFTGEEGR
ncbi:SDR family NAD(P)-dependent oxidoreductase [Streptomyces sp. NPDC001717]|uniref:SDR family NAD(P)-dependent oxidoreductase n=1 Tax=Streptomyces sp. NPDC001717 TaxID=3364604 RepID=UPI0036858524